MINKYFSYFFIVLWLGILSLTIPTFAQNTGITPQALKVEIQARAKKDAQLDKPHKTLHELHLGFGDKAKVLRIGIDQVEEWYDDAYEKAKPWWKSQQMAWLVTIISLLSLLALTLNKFLTDFLTWLKLLRERSYLRRQVKKQENELLRSRQMVAIARMASSLAHEIMQPLQIILMKADNCSWEVEHDKTSKEYILKDLIKIIDTTQRIAHIVKYLRILSQEHRPKLELVNINTVIENSLTLFSEQLKSHHITFEKKLAVSLPLIQSDKLQLEQVMIILMSNARDALEGCDEKRITISTLEQKNKIQIQMADNGVGIAPEELPNIFNAFVTTKEKIGTGIGLYIAQNIVQTYHGQMTVTSQINEGTTFFVTFPIVKEEKRV